MEEMRCLYQSSPRQPPTHTPQSKGMSVNAPTECPSTRERLPCAEGGHMGVSRMGMNRRDAAQWRLVLGVPVKYSSRQAKDSLGRIPSLKAHRSNNAEPPSGSLQLPLRTVNYLARSYWTKNMLSLDRCCNLYTIGAY